jgi:hypothetical protein
MTWFLKSKVSLTNTYKSRRNKMTYNIKQLTRNEFILTKFT